MTSTPHRDRPEAGADTQLGREGKGSKPAKGDSGGHRTPAGSTYGDYVPDRGQEHRNDALDSDPVMGNYYTGGGDVEHLGERADAPQSPDKPQRSDTTPPAGTTRPAADETTDPAEQAEQGETAAEANRNKSFDTTHVHSGATTRKV